MPHAPKVSVVLSVFNDERYVRAAVESILKQSFTDFELLLFDDGSKDATPEILASFDDPRIVLDCSPVNLGIVAQVNKGLDKARGEYIARMDGDDIAYPERFSRQVAFLDAHPEVGICGAFVRRVSEQTSDPWTFPVRHEEIQAALFFRGGFCNPTTMLRRSALTGAGLRYDPDFPLAEDYHLWYRLLKTTRGANLPDFLLDYRLSASQITQVESTVKLQRLRQIRGLILADLGLAVDDALLDFHDSVVGYSWPVDRAFFESAVAWLEKLIQLNAKARLFDPDAFAAELSQHLQMRCQIAASRQLNGWRIYNRSVFARSFPLERRAQARMLAKSLLKR